MNISNTFKDASTPTFNPNGSSIVFDNDWTQGRGVYGGMLFACLVRTVESIAKHPIRSLSVELCAPVLPNIECTIQCIQKRYGMLSAFYSLELHQNGKCALIGTAVCAANRKSADDTVFLLPPEVISHTELNPISSGMMPPFSQHLDYRVAIGNLPFSQSNPEVGGWVTFKSPGEPQSYAMTAALIDAWWPSYMTQLQSLVPMGTISFSMSFVERTPLQVRPCLLFNQSHHISGGYITEHNTLWDDKGQLLAQAQQIVALIHGKAAPNSP
jgi:hypothetical protein